MRKLMLIFCLVAGANLFGQAADVNPKAETLLTNFMKALMIQDANTSATECLKYVHKSLMNKAGSDLTQDLRNFSFKKAHDNAKFYSIPVKITRVKKTAVTAIGFKETGEKGEVHDYFISKIDDKNGLPAPVKIFFPSNGGDPKISYMGSL